LKSDAELVGAVLDGDKEAFASLVRRYERSVRAVAVQVVGDRHRAADVAQDAFVKAYENLGGLRKADAFGMWLMRIARRCASDARRKRPREVRLEEGMAGALEERNGELDGDKKALLAAVMKLPRAERQVVMLRYFSGHSVKGVAEAAGRSVGTVTKQLSRAHKRLRTILKEPGQ
jgi:RNA polymerase sigma-70 factor (ECF subfamily)